MISEIFVSTLARSGGTLFSSLMSSHSKIELAAHPNLEFFKYARNCAYLKNYLTESKLKNRPLNDWYGSDELSLKTFNFIINELNLDSEKILPSDLNQFIENSISRGSLDCPDLVDHYKDIKSENLKKVIDNLLGAIIKERSSSKTSKIGFIEPWIIDFLPSLARSYPNAKFIVWIRDIRGTVNSLIGMNKIEPAQSAQILSYCRHWRKQIGLASLYKKDPLFKERLLVESYENLLSNPEKTIEKICNFVGVEKEELMLDTKKYKNYSKTGGGKSSFASSNSEGIKLERATWWRSKLDSQTINLINFLCYVELKICGYLTETYKYSLDSKSFPIDKFIKDYKSEVSWQSTNNNLEMDLGIEIMRFEFLSGNDLVIENFNESEISSLFLKKEILFDLIKFNSSKEKLFNLSPN